MTDPSVAPYTTSSTKMRHPLRGGVAVGALALMLTLTGCGPETPEEPPSSGVSDTQEAPAETTPAPDEAAVEEPASAKTQEETCDWNSPKATLAANAPAGQEGELSEVLIGAWQHTHTDEGSGFEEVTNDHRYVFPAAERMLYCQHVPGITEHAENAADVTLNGSAIELPGGQYAYTVTAWDEDTMLWDNPVGGGYVYLLQRR